jgi:hypothetical protein
MTKTPFETLAAFGTALYGPQWMMPLCVETGVNYKTFTRWKSGESPLRLDNQVFSDLRKILRRKSRELGRLAIVAEAIVARNGTRHGRAAPGKVVLMQQNALLSR